QKGVSGTVSQPNGLKRLIIWPGSSGYNGKGGKCLTDEASIFLFASFLLVARTRRPASTALPGLFHRLTQVDHRHRIKIAAVVMRNGEEVGGAQPVFSRFRSILQVNQAIQEVGW